ncbi:MAG: hypothetical protein H7143_10290 [Pseudorhodobacter sp.]|nr:hypothetical protein [Rhizobacter sp.]
MISRLTAFAALFAVVSTATLAFAASSAQDQTVAQSSNAKAMPVYQLERVVIIGKRAGKRADQRADNVKN